ncbi:MAG: hypothetical protein HW389_3282 [Bacteroidetes bacterium]|nr:hypothetical protein [Bacteroidota bacterium]MBM2845791.1 hypothetical protein [Bacteroidota bacterium]
MAELKTKRNDGSVTSFLKTIPDAQKREDSFAVLEIMKQVTKQEPTMWGTSIVGFGIYHYKYETGREGDWFLIGFSPRKQDLTLYVMGGFAPHGPIMKRLGKYRTGKSCLYIKKLADIDIPALKALLNASLKDLAKRLP